MGRMDNKVAVITGGAAGIGLATAKAFLDEGAKVFLSDLNEEGMKGLQLEIGEDRVGYRVGDVSKETDVSALMAAAEKEFGGVDVVFANAGIEGKFAPLAETTPEAFQKVVDVNMKGALLTVKHAIAPLQKRGGGAIVITSSVAGVTGSAGLTPYVMSKHAVIGLMRCAAVELAPLNIRVNTVNPGPIETRMMRSIEDQASPGHATDVKAGFEAMVPLKRYGHAEEIARTVLFLASEDASYCTGGVYMVDGGFTTG